MATAVVVYESVFGDAERIARAVAEGLAQHLDVEVVAAAGARRPAASVACGPSRGPDHGLSRCAP